MQVSKHARRAGALAALLAACAGGGDGEGNAEDSAAAAESAAAAVPATPPSMQGAPTDAPLTVADLDAYEKGVAREIEVIDAAAKDLGAAKSSTDTLAALGKAMEHETRAAGAAAAGVPIDRYRTISTTVDGWLGGASMDEPMRKQLDDSEKGIADLPADQQAAMKANLAERRKELEQMRETREAGIPAEIREALRTRGPRLDSLRTGLVAARFRMLR